MTAPVPTAPAARQRAKMEARRLRNSIEHAIEPDPTTPGRFQLNDHAVDQIAAVLLAVRDETIKACAEIAAEPTPDADTYPPPTHGWTCFHCGETFHNLYPAIQHFGERPTAKPACLLTAERKLLRALRAAEHERDEYKVRYNALKLGVPEADVLARWRATGVLPC